MASSPQGSPGLHTGPAPPHLEAPPLGKRTKRGGVFALRLDQLCCLQNSQQGLPWWRSGWESACRCRGRGFEPWSGRIPRAAERLGP